MASRRHDLPGFTDTQTKIYVQSADCRQTYTAHTEKTSTSRESDKIHVLELYLHALGNNASDPPGHLQTCQPQSYRTLSTTNNKMGYHINPSNESYPICRRRIGSCQTLLSPCFQHPWCVRSEDQVCLYLGQRACWWVLRDCSECVQRRSPQLHQ